MAYGRSPEIIRWFRKWCAWAKYIRKKPEIIPKKNIITRALGAERTVDVDFFDLKLDSESYILMCSDGLSNMVDDRRMEDIVLSGSGDLTSKGRALIEEANENGGKDNIAVILVEPFANEVEAC